MDPDLIARSRTPENVRWSPAADTTAKVCPDDFSIEIGDNATTTGNSFDFVKQLSTMVVGDSSFLPCQDYASAQSSLAALRFVRNLVNDSAAPDCNAENETSKAYYAPICGKANMAELRAICPRTCGCADMWSSSLGSFQRQRFGCPMQCLVLRNALISFYGM